MTTSPTEVKSEVQAVDIQIDAEVLRVVLSDGRTVTVELRRVGWLSWLHDATADKRSNWTIEPGGFAVYWPDLDDGVEVRHLLSLRALT